MKTIAISVLLIAFCSFSPSSLEASESNDLSGIYLSIQTNVDEIFLDDIGVVELTSSGIINYLGGSTPSNNYFKIEASKEYDFLRVEEWDIEKIDSDRIMINGKIEKSDFVSKWYKLKPMTNLKSQIEGIWHAEVKESYKSNEKKEPSKCDTTFVYNIMISYKNGRVTVLDEEPEYPYYNTKQENGICYFWYEDKYHQKTKEVFEVYHSKDYMCFVKRNKEGNFSTSVVHTKYKDVMYIGLDSTNNLSDSSPTNYRKMVEEYYKSLNNF